MDIIIGQRDASGQGSDTTCKIGHINAFGIWLTSRGGFGVAIYEVVVLTIISKESDYYVGDWCGSVILLYRFVV